MLNKSGTQIEWGHVAKLALGHPFESGLMSMGAGGTGVALGVAAHDPFLVTSGATLTGLGALRFHRFAYNCG